MSRKTPTRPHPTQTDDNAAAVFARGFGEMAGIQSRAVSECMNRRMTAMRTLASGPVQASLAQGKLMQEDAAAFSRCFGEMAAAAMEMQSEVAACCVRMVDSTAVLEAAHALD